MSKKIPDDFSHRDLSIAVGDLLPHPKLQRRFKKSHAERIRDEFDPAMLGLIWVQEKNGRYYVIDGQHRIWATLQWLKGEKRQEVTCRVFTNLTDERAALITRKVNNTKAWQALDTFLNRIVERDTVALAIQSVLARIGLKVSKSRGENVVQAVSACERAFLRLGEADFARVVNVLHGAWAGDPDAYSAPLVDGLALFINRYNGTANTDDLRHKLAKSGDPTRIIGLARSAAKPFGYTMPHAVAHTLTVEYNKGRRGPGKLPDWKRSA